MKPSLEGIGAQRNFGPDDSLTHRAWTTVARAVVCEKGYVGTSVTVKAGTPLAPFLVMDAVGILASGGSALALQLAGSLGFLYNGLYANHVSQPLRSFLNLHPALGGVNLQTYQPVEVTQTALDQLVTMSAATYEAQQPAELAAFYQSLRARRPEHKASAAVPERLTRHLMATVV